MTDAYITEQQPIRDAEQTCRAALKQQLTGGNTMEDVNGIEVVCGSICFYTERPYSNYADAIVEVYEKQGKLFVGTHVFNKGFGDSLSDEYILHDFPSNNDVELRFCTGNDLTVIDIERPEISVEYANENYPLTPCQS